MYAPEIITAIVMEKRYEAEDYRRTHPAGFRRRFRRPTFRPMAAREIPIVQTHGGPARV
jgi:hypothetical protein